MFAHNKRLQYTVRVTETNPGLANLMLLAARREFHIFLHPPRRIIATSERHGLRPLLNQNGVLWIVSALRRAV